MSSARKASDDVTRPRRSRLALPALALGWIASASIGAQEAPDGGERRARIQWRLGSHGGDEHDDLSRRDSIFRRDLYHDDMHWGPRFRRAGRPAQTATGELATAGPAGAAASTTTGGLVPSDGSSVQESPPSPSGDVAPQTAPGDASAPATTDGPLAQSPQRLAPPGAVNPVPDVPHGAMPPMSPGATPHSSQGPTPHASQRFAPRTSQGVVPQGSPDLAPPHARLPQAPHALPPASGGGTIGAPHEDGLRSRRHLRFRATAERLGHSDGPSLESRQDASAPGAVLQVPPTRVLPLMPDAAHPASTRRVPPAAALGTDLPWWARQDTTSSEGVRSTAPASPREFEPRTSHAATSSDGQPATAAPPDPDEEAAPDDGPDGESGGS